MSVRADAAPREDVVEIAIEEIGAKGDGIGHAGGTPIFVPYTVPGDRVRARLGAARERGRAASIIEILAPGPGRVAPPCPHFGTCGGCALQHVADGVYAEWKRGLVLDALKKRALEAGEIAPLIRVGPGTRRRATLKAMRTKEHAFLGFYERESHRIVDLEACPVLESGLAALIEPLRGLLTEILPPHAKADIELTLLPNGIDATVDAKESLSMAIATRLAAFAEARDLARLSWRHARAKSAEPVVERRPPQATFADVAVTIPPGAFLQPTEAGERMLIDLVGAACGGAEKIADLFAGCGTFAFPLAREGRIHAVEGEDLMIAAMRAATGRAGTRVRLTAETRDLERRPLLASELDAFDAVVFDPPRPGAKRQAQEIAQSALPLVAAVSCNPTTFARDARALCDGGYRLEAVTPIDQFLWSPHVELVAVFRR